MSLVIKKSKNKEKINFTKYWLKNGSVFVRVDNTDLKYLKHHNWKNTQTNPVIT